MLVSNVFNFIKGRVVLLIIDLSMPLAIVFKNSDIQVVEDGKGELFFGNSNACRVYTAEAIVSIMQVKEVFKYSVTDSDDVVNETGCETEMRNNIEFLKGDRATGKAELTIKHVEVSENTHLVVYRSEYLSPASVLYRCQC